VRRSHLWLASALALVTAAAAFAQRTDPRRPATFIVGPTPGVAPTVRGDAHRTGVVRSPLPRAPLHVEWRFSAGGIEQPPVVTADAITIVSTNGNVIAVGHDGAEKWHQGLGVSSSNPSAPALLADGTLVVVAGAVDAVAVGVQKSGVRFRTPLVGGLDPSLAPLAMDDGGVAVASESELALLDASGNVRFRAPLPEPVVGPLLAQSSPTGSRILVAGKATGVVFAWTPGRDVVRVGSFGAQVKGGAVLVDDNTLLAVVEGPRLMTLDLRQGLAVPLSTFAGGSYFWPPAYRRGVAYTMAGLAGRTFAVGVDSAGQEVLRVPVATSLPGMADAGAGPYVPPPHAPVIVDETGTLGFAAPDGPVGVVDPAGIVSTVGEAVCGRVFQSRRAVTSVSSGGPGAMLVTCGTGNLVRIVHGVDVGEP